MSERLYSLAEITESLTLRSTLQEQIEQLASRVASLTVQVEKLRANALRAIETDSKVFLSRREAAAILSISVSTVDQLIIQGRIKPRRVGRRILIPRAQLDPLARRDIGGVWPPKREGKTVRQ